MNALNQHEVPFYTNDLLAQLCLNTPTMSQTNANIANQRDNSDLRVSWLMKFTEASYKGWREQGSPSYGL